MKWKHRLICSDDCAISPMCFNNGTGSGERETGNAKRETGNGKRETGNGKRDRERAKEAGNACAAVTCLRIQNGGQRKRNGEMWRSESWVLRAMPPDDQLHVLVGEESDWHWINKACNGALRENRISIITSYPNQLVQNVDCRPSDCRLGNQRRLRTKTVSLVLRDMLSQNILVCFSAVTFHNISIYI